MLLYSAARVVELWSNWQQSHGRGSLSPGRGEWLRSNAPHNRGDAAVTASFTNIPQAGQGGQVVDGWHG
eukprot:3390535-Pleurochrysis_carterae.AAC.1